MSLDTYLLLQVEGLYLAMHEHSKVSEEANAATVIPRNSHDYQKKKKSHC